MVCRRGVAENYLSFLTLKAGEEISSDRLRVFIAFRVCFCYNKSEQMFMTKLRIGLFYDKELCYSVVRSTHIDCFVLRS